jgi:riboflavin kinase
MSTLVGHIESGVGNFGYWIKKLHVHYRHKTGLDLFPGTLNIRLDHPYRIPPNPIRLEATEYGGTVNINLVPCHVFNRPAFILRTDANEQGNGIHPWEVIEIATDIKLRDAFNLKDGDHITVELDI